MSTIFALSSGSLPAAIAVFRLSGPRSLAALQEVSRREKWKSREMKYTRLWTKDSRLLDTAMAVYLPGPSTFTGEDSAELFVHGSKAVAEALASRLAAIEEIRPAARGEFAKRAFYNGKMDLEEVHGLRHLISAETERQRQLSYAQMGGGAHLRRIRDKIAELVMRSFILMDFGEHVETSYSDIRDLIRPVLCEMEGLTRRSRAAEMVHRGLRIVLVGRPNTGKSSILNALAMRDVAIVSGIAGTTRDSLEVRLNIGGVPVTVTDTAGLRESADEIEMEGVRRARQKIRDADVVVAVTDSMDDDTSTAALLKETEDDCGDCPIVLVRNKCDIPSGSPTVSSPSVVDTVSTCALSPKGVNPLVSSLESILGRLCPEEEGSSVAEPALLEEAVDALEKAVLAEDAALLCTHLEEANSLMGQLAGDTVSEELLDRLFQQFCIGK